jgi:hypothetical protein
MPKKSDEEIRKSVEEFEKNLPEDQRNPNAKETFDELISRAAKPVRPKPEKPAQSEDYIEKQTHSRSAEDTSDSRSDTSHQ